jgi:hypothetical protein
MVSITRCSRSDSLTALLAVLVALLFAFGAGSARAGSIEPVRGQLTPGEDGYVLSAQFTIELGPRIEEALVRGVSLAFNLEFDLTRRRWYWFDEHIASKTIDYRLSYNALTQQYRLSIGGLHSSYASLAEALHVLGHIDGVVVAERSAVSLGNAYRAELRLALDKGQLPKPLQLDAVASKDWQVEAKTLSWQFAPGVVGR